MNLIQYPLQRKRYIASPTVKKNIVVHGTNHRTANTAVGGLGGRASALVDYWNIRDDKFGAPYIVDRDGTVFQTFEDDKWIFHLSLPKGKGQPDKDSLAIEVANETVLVRKDNLFYAFGNTHHSNVYSGKVYAKTLPGRPEYAYWADLDEEQVDALGELLLSLCEKHKLPPTMLKTEAFLPNPWGHASIIRHLNCREASYDLPFNAWVYERLTKAGIEFV